MRKFILALLFAILIGVVVYIFLKAGVDNHPVVPSTNSPTSTSTPSANQDRKTWSDDDITVQYPSYFTVKTQNIAGAILNPSQPIVQFAFPERAFATTTPRNNFSEGFATVSMATSSIAIANCYTNELGAPNATLLDKTSTINNTTWHTSDMFTDAAAGNLYTTELYRTVHNNACYELALTVHTTNVGNYSPGIVTEFDKEQAFSILRTIRDTFSFKQ